MTVKTDRASVGQLYTALGEALRELRAEHDAALERVERAKAEVTRLRLELRHARNVLKATSNDTHEGEIK